MTLWPLQEPGGTGVPKPSIGELLDDRLELDEQSIEALSDQIERLTARVAFLEAPAAGGDTAQPPRGTERVSRCRQTKVPGRRTPGAAPQRQRQGPS